jgi:hypothetical protein
MGESFLKNYFFIMAVPVCTLAAAPRAEANDGQWAQIYALSQQGQDVDIVVSAHPWDEDTEFDTDSDSENDEISCYDGDPWLNSLYVGRADEPGAAPDVFVVSDMNLKDKAPTAEIEYCRDPDPTWCEDNDCNDCDEDSNPECPDDCCPLVLFTVRDKCVPPGSYWYHSMQDFEPPNDVHSDGTRIDVLDSGDRDCDFGDDCGCSIPGALNGNPLIFLLLAVGLIALVADRRRRR